MRIADFLSALFSIVILSKKPPFYTPLRCQKHAKLRRQGPPSRAFPRKAFLHSAPLSAPTAPRRRCLRFAADSASLSAHIDKRGQILYSTESPQNRRPLCRHFQHVRLRSAKDRQKPPKLRAGAGRFQNGDRRYPLIAVGA